MDKNIDPSIADSELFQVSLERDGKDTQSLISHSIDTDSTVQDDNASIRNVFRLNEYVSDATQHGHNGSTAAAALNMIQYNGFEHTTTDNHGNNDEDHLSGASHYADFSNNALLDEGFLLDHDKPVSAVKLVQYKPNEKTKRLGRPRKHISKALTSPADSSSQNFNEAILSKFRLDALPLEGPGSRGGRQNSRKNPRGRISSTSIRKRKSQSLLNFNVDRERSTSAFELDSEISESTTQDNDAQTVENKESPDDDIKTTENSITSDKDENITNVESTPDLIEVSSDSDTLISEDIEDKSNKKENSSLPSKRNNSSSIPTTTSRNTKRKPIKRNSRVMSTSRTTVLNNRHKVTRQLPGPIIPLYYDLYDDNVLDASQNEEAASEKIALGFPISQAPYAKDILYIISYLSKFQSILDLGLIGPQDIEAGLSLPTPIITSSDKCVLRTQTPTTNHDSDYVSPVMNELFLKLLGLILNRKRDITSQENAISELKARVLYLGLPPEWRSDLSQSDIKESNKLQNFRDTETENPPFEPFYFAPFESDGLKGLEPSDRLVMIRVLMQWSLNASDKVRDFVSYSIQNQDFLGDKDTYYVSRSVAKGFKNCEDAKREAENKIKHRKSDLNDLKYVDPVSDPFKHSMRLRLDESFAGDCGFHVGRFYFCRMTSGNSGGLSTVKKMRSMLSETFTLPYSSSFKLYVQDVHLMLGDSLTNYGVEFDNEKEIVTKKLINNYYYEVATNPDELKEFVDFLSKRLGLTISNNPIKVIPKTSMIYKPVMNVFNYLSWVLEIIIKQFSMQSNDTGSRSLRRKNVDYNQTKINKELGKLINDNHIEDEEEEHIDFEKFDDDDYYEDEDDDEDMDGNDEYAE